MGGKDCKPLNAAEEMNATKKLYDKADGRSYCHIIQSFKPGEITPESAHKIGIELAEEQFKNHEVLIATHKDKEHKRKIPLNLSQKKDQNKKVLKGRDNE